MREPYASTHPQATHQDTPPYRPTPLCTATHETKEGEA